MLVALVLCAAVFWAAIFFTFFYANGTSAGEVFFGAYEPVPADNEQWLPLADEALFSSPGAPQPRDGARHTQALSELAEAALERSALGRSQVRWEQRWLLPHSSSRFALLQVRARLLNDASIVCVLPEQRVARRRVGR